MKTQLKNGLPCPFMPWFQASCYLIALVCFLGSHAWAQTMRIPLPPSAMTVTHTYNVATQVHTLRAQFEESQPTGLMGVEATMAMELDTPQYSWTDLGWNSSMSNSEGVVEFKSQPKPRLLAHFYSSDSQPTSDTFWVEWSWISEEEDMPVEANCHIDGIVQVDIIIGLKASIGSLQTDRRVSTTESVPESYSLSTLAGLRIRDSRGQLPSLQGLAPGVYLLQAWHKGRPIWTRKLRTL